MVVIEKLCQFVEAYEEKATLISEGKKEKKDRDPKAEIRNRGDVIFPAESSKVKDDKDHFEMNDIGQARSALSRSHQYDKVPPWYKGTLKELQETVRRKVHKKYPSIEISKDKKSSKKSSLDVVNDFLTKYAQDNSQTLKLPTTVISGYRPIDPTFQIMLGVNPDGKLGQITQTALDTFKKSVGNPQMTNEQAFVALKAEPEYTSKTKLQYDDNQNVYATSASRQQDQSVAQIDNIIAQSRRLVGKIWEDMWDASEGQKSMSQNQIREYLQAVSSTYQSLQPYLNNPMTPEQKQSLNAIMTQLQQTAPSLEQLAIQTQNKNQPQAQASKLEELIKKYA